MTQTAAKGRKYNTARNLAWGIAAQLATSLIRFVIRTVIVRNLGLEYVSLNGLFNEIISMMTLSELGIGTAITYSLYKPIADGDEEKMCQLMTLYKKAYRVIAVGLLGIGLLLTPFIPKLVDDIGFPQNYIRLIFMLFVIKTGCSYFYSYKFGIISANQKMYLVTTIQSAFQIVSLLASLGVLLLTREFVAYLAVQIVFTVLGNMFISRKADAMYPFLKRSAELPAEESKLIFKNIRSVFVSRISGVITNSTDNILITLLISTLTVGLYSNYSIVYATLHGIINQLQSAVTASVGNMFATDSVERCERTLDYITFLLAIVGCLCACCLNCAVTPLVRVWLGAEYVIDASVVFVLSLNLFFTVAHVPLWLAMPAAGLFKYDKYTSILGSSANLVVSVILGLRWGLLGIFIGTSATHIIQIITKSMLLYRKAFNSTAARNLLTWLLYTVLCMACMALNAWLCDLLPPMNAFIDLALRVVIPALTTSAILVLCFFKTAKFTRLKHSLGGYANKVLRRFRAA